MAERASPPQPRAAFADVMDVVTEEDEGTGEGPDAGAAVAGRPAARSALKGQDSDARERAPRQRVVIRTNSIGSAAPSKASFAGSGASSAAMGAMLMNNTGLGLTILQRDEWSQKV